MSWLVGCSNHAICAAMYIADKNFKAVGYNGGFQHAHTVKVVRWSQEDSYLIDLTDDRGRRGIPYYFQKLGVELEREIVITGKRKITPTDIEHGFTRFLEELSADFLERWETRFSDQQRTVLKTLATAPMSVSKIARAPGITAPNLSYNLSRLTAAMILTKERREYRITDRVFTAWCANCDHSV